MHRKSFLLKTAPHWKKNQPGIKQTIPKEVQSWIYEQGSLTHRLRKVYGPAFTVEILFHRWKPAYLSECQLLNLPQQQYNLTREVLLHANGIPLILARTIIPSQTIKSAKRNLSHLGTRPLGEVIFSYPKLERLTLKISCINEQQWTQQIHEQVKIPKQTWGRQTVYAIHSHKMLVSEFFMPEVLNH